MGDEVPGIFTATERYMPSLPFRGSGLNGLPFGNGFTTPSFFAGLTRASIFFFNVIPPENKLVFPDDYCHCKNYTLSQELVLLLKGACG
jgi:hypothetical protein